MKYSFWVLVVLFLNFSQVFGQKVSAFKDWETNKWGFKDTEGNIIIPAKYTHIDSFSEGLARTIEAGEYGKANYGFYDTLGNIAIPFEYKYLDPFSDGLAMFIKDGKRGAINKQNEIVIPAEYDDLGYFHEGWAGAKKNGRAGFIDKQNKVVIPFVYDLVLWYEEGLACVHKNGKRGFIDKQNNVIIPLEYDIYGSGAVFSEGIVNVKTLDGKYRYYNKLGKPIAPLFTCREVSPFSEGFSRVVINRKLWGYYNQEGKLAFSFECIHATDFEKGEACIEKEEWKFFYINKKGECIRGECP